MILLADADVEEHAEPDAEDVEVQVAALDGRGALALEVADLEGVHDARLAEEVPRRLRGTRVLRVREVRARDDLQVLVGEDVDRRTHHVVRAAGHDERRALRQLRRKELERGRHEQDARLNVDRLAVRVHLVGEELDRLLERVRREGGVRAREEVLVVAAEERLAVHARRVLQETLEEELVHKAGCAIAHRRRHLEERAEIVVDDHLAREAELLRVGLELVLRRLLGKCPVLDLAVRADGLQVADVGEAEAVVLLEVREVARRAELGGDDGLRLIRLHELLVRDVREDAGERDGRERRLDRLVVERAGDAHPLDPHALAEDAGERHVRVLHRRLDGLLAHVLHELVAADAGAEGKRGFESLRGHRVLLLDGDVHVGGRLLLTERRQHRLVQLVLLPALGNGLRLDLRELALADRLDHRDAVALGLDRLLGDGLRVNCGRVHRRGGRLDLRRCGGGGSCGRVDGSGGLNLGSCRSFFLLGFHDGVAFQFEFCRDLHVSCLVGPHRDHGHLAEG